jgi:hypothetical protein
MDISDIKEKVRNSRYKISFTHTERLRQRRIEIRELEEAIFSGDIIEKYPGDPQGPSCLVLGYTQRNRPLHIVCGIMGEKWLILRHINLALRSGNLIGRQGDS